MLRQLRLAYLAMCTAVCLFALPIAYHKTGGVDPFLVLGIACSIYLVLTTKKN